MPGIEKQNWDELLVIIQESQSILLSTHINADGDGLGSEIAFYYYLQSLNKECRIINSTPLPGIYNVIDPNGIVEEYSDSMNKWLNNIDLTIVFDIGDYRRVGDIAKKVYGHCTSVSIDHHPIKENTPFDINIVDSSAPATGYLLWKYFQHVNFTDDKLPINIASALYASIVTDTGSFKYQCTTADTHYMAAHLIESGVDCYKIQKNIYEQRKLSQVQLLGEVIHSLKRSKNGKVVWITITQHMIQKVEGEDEDVDGFTEFLRSIDGVEISFMILEKSDGTHRISFRSSGKYTVNDVAQKFDGGGHKFAAGASIRNLSSKEIEENIMRQLTYKIEGAPSVNQK